MHSIDFYDDPQGEILKSKVARENLPDFIKTAHYITEEERQVLPDDVYALVMVDRHSKMRKFACADKGNAALSVIYFLENHDYLPEEAQKTAAKNLVTACGWYDMKPPLQLLKLADGEIDYLKGQVKRGRTVQVKPLSPAEKAERSEKAEALDVRMDKGADLIGTEIMPTSAPIKKTAGALQPYVDVEGKSAPIRVAQPPRYEDEFYCLVKEGEAHFPIKNYSEVQQAAQFFDDKGVLLHPEERREYCVKLAARAEALGIPLSDGIRKYAGKGYAPDGEIKVAVHTRLQFWTEDGPERDLLKGLLEKRASIHPDVFAEALRLFDEATGLNHRWDEAIYDPYYSTYGFTKEATWSFVTGNDRITEDQLNVLVKSDHKGLKCKFGPEIADELVKKPREIFDSLPLDSKRIIMRMANEVGRTKAL